MKPLASTLVWSFLILAGCATPKTPQTGHSSAAELRSAIDARQYIFKARSVSPTGGRTRQLNTEYDVRITGDTLVAFLPYFGRAYSAPIDPSKGGIQFTSLNFDYAATERDKGGWTIQIRPRDVQDVREFFLSVSSEGYGSLQASSNSRQPISFSGIVEPYASRKR